MLWSLSNCARSEEAGCFWTAGDQFTFQRNRPPQMTIDTYTTCPCGSGKKIKFCKCKDSVGEMDRVVKMMEGGQLVAALDRLNQILEEHPSAAWALAVRGRLLIEMREYGTLASNAERFVRLQPSNPLALAQLSLALMTKGDVAKATETMLQGLNEVGPDVDQFFLMVSSTVAIAHLENRAFLSATAWDSLSQNLPEFQEQRERSAGRMLSRSPEVNQFLKGPFALLERPEDVEWGERYDEAAGLMHHVRILAAEPKLESLDRQYRGEPAILSGLLNCAIWRGDVERQQALFGKLAKCESLGDEEQARMLALSALVEPDSSLMSVGMEEHVYTINDFEAFTVACTANSRIVGKPVDDSYPAEAEDGGVPPRFAYQILNAPYPEVASAAELPPVAEVPGVLASALAFGRQTDRAARLKAYVMASKADALKSLLTDLLGGEVEMTSETLRVFMAHSLQREMPHPFQAALAGKTDSSAASVEYLREGFVDTVMQLKLPLFDDKAVSEVVDDDQYRIQRLALVRTLQNQSDLAIIQGENLAKLAEKLGVSDLPPIVVTDAESENVKVYELPQVDLSQADAETTFLYLNYAEAYVSRSAVMEAADRLIELDPPGDLRRAKLAAYVAKASGAPDHAEALAILGEGRQWAEANEVPAPSILLSILPHALLGGAGPVFEETVSKLLSEYREDPNVMARLQQLLVNFGLINPDGTPRNAPQASPEPQGGLWTPDQGDAPAGAPPAADGGSKLWVPGMD
ncbi:hypothetical protein FF011L_09530 [Roseimaritima multifibrata]|uniref:Uncharacterized protein n=1 Tax=Roseimaritima multifibrata TaxID=1930274 RepID=A0A517MBF2_9BACT|nr:protein-disulfide isomerase [Roseimaritima multifibrata]QDS92216.1 hypothetical protein FF011L_09530 [Roseimaritima multifibrata]